MKIADAHIHIGSISATEIVKVSEVKRFVTQQGIERAAVMPVAMVGGNDDWQIHRKLYSEAMNEGFDLILYINLQMLEIAKDLSAFLQFPFKALKIHPYAVCFNDNQLDDIFNLAGELHLPLYIHTGGNENSNAGRFMKFAKRHPFTTIVLCHARPACEAFEVLEICKNAWIDTAFFDVFKLQKYLHNSNEDRIMFGSDYPINRCFSSLLSENLWYKNQIDVLISFFSERVVRKLFFDNYQYLFL